MTLCIYDVRRPDQCVTDSVGGSFLGVTWIAPKKLITSIAVGGKTYRANGSLQTYVNTLTGQTAPVMSADGPTVSGAFPSSSADATLVAFVHYGKPASNTIPEKLQVYDADTLSVKTVATANQMADIDGDPLQYPLISPDGSLIATEQTGSDPGFGVTVYPVDGSAPIKGGHYVWPAPVSWSFDGRLAFAGAPGGADWQSSTVWVWKPGGGKPAKIIAPTAYPITSLAWSPKASQIAYAVGRRSGLTSDLWVANADGSNPHLLLAKAGRPAWAEAPISFP
ncbi:MAG TPA: WD40 repeat domain-containing protein [Thermoleophilia bacterium]|nr:WD40 repeat domain-containing protein [Thermoleophilia bacterium]